MGAQVKESVKLMLFGDQQEDTPDSLLQWLTSNFVSKSDLQTLLRDLELQILKNITLHMSVTKQKLTSEVVTNAVTNAGISGITEAVSELSSQKFHLNCKGSFYRHFVEHDCRYKC